MRLKIPPVVVTLIIGLLMFILAKFLPFGDFSFTGRIYLMYVLLGLGALIGLWSLVQFFNKKTSVNPLAPDSATKLVSGGIYSITRNPMYLSLLLLLLAWGLFLGNAFNTLLAAAFVSYMNRYQIKPEEEALEKIFGNEFLAYKIKVRRWF